MSWSASLVLALPGLSLDVALEGKGVTALIGPNGSGKSTLLRWIAGAPLPGSGQVRIGERSFGASSPPDARSVGFLPQRQGLVAHLSVLENVTFGLAVRGVQRSERETRGLEMLRRFEAEGLATRSVGALSGGERQRVALARAFVAKCAMYLLDEPFAALDAAARRRVRATTAGLLAGAPALVATHDVRDVEAFADEVAVVERGKLTQQGTVQALREAPATDYVAEFFAAGDRPPT